MPAAQAAWKLRAQAGKGGGEGVVHIGPQVFPLQRHRSLQLLRGGGPRLLQLSFTGRLGMTEVTMYPEGTLTVPLQVKNDQDLSLAVSADFLLRA